ncbi:MAG TPA: carbohydrate-binding protein CenC [Janthinobacterium sp.]|nr:carbohydrate-binding protein CenC [Janthinobacterium sp.]
MLLAFSAPAQASDIASEHREFDATLHVPYVADALATGEQQEARTFTLAFDYPTVERAQDVTWRLELLNASGQVLRRWHGVERLFQRPVDVKIAWSGRADGLTLPDGVYQVRMRAVANDATSKGKASELSEEGVDRVLAAAADDELVEQSWDMALGQAEAPAMPRFAPLATSAIPAIHAKAGAGARVDAVALSAPAPAALPYTVYFGNLHSQTNHSDGGGNLASCVGAQAPQSGAFGPTDAYAYAMNRGLDILMASEHNHMFDGSDSTNTAADPVKAKALYQSGLKAATDFNAAHPAFLAVYGLEWGVINNGGHMNIFNTPELLGWESNASGQLIADTLTPKGDYAGLYTLMRQRGWVGQFNHPATSGQFLVNGVPLGYTADGDDVMTMCEVLNSSAFSVNTTESETGRSNYEGACNKALEAGYHVAFSSDQDNHCANWGASYTNRTGVLIPTGTPLSNSSFIDALKARRVFATMDKSAQLVLTANGHMMGERFSNGGVLNLLANFASASGKTAASVVIYEGVPGRNGTVSQLSVTASTTITPAIGEHFYYAKVTENDGNILWSAPIWVSQSNAADGTAPSVSVAESGAAGNITLSATASDNVGVTMVEFYVDGALKSGTNAAPYVATLNSATLSNGNHSLTARAYDAAGNVGLSGALTFSVNNGGGDTIPPTVSASASGGSGAVTLAATASDNVGVTRVEFSVDNVLKGSSATAPYSLTLAAGVLPAGNHTLTVKAYDAANNSATSSAVNFSVGGTAQQLIVNGGFESGASGWTSSSGVISSDSSEAARAGVYKAWLDGYGAAHTDTLYQQVLIPASATGANLSFWLKVASSDTSTTTAYDTLKVQIRNSSGAVLSTLATYSNLNKGSSYLQKTFDVSAYKGQNIRIYFVGVENSTISTSFLVDDVSLTLP